MCKCKNVLGMLLWMSLGFILFISLLKTIETGFINVSTGTLSITRNTSSMDTQRNKAHRITRNNLYEVHSIFYEHKGYKTRGLPTSYFPIQITDKLYFSSAFLDLRFNKYVVRILGMKPRNGSHSVSCIFKNKFTNLPIIASARETIVYEAFPDNSLYIAVIWTCAAPSTNPQQVHIVPAGATRGPQALAGATLPVQKGPIMHENKNISSMSLAACVKPIHGNPDYSKLVEWIEIHRMVGVHYFAFYVGYIKDTMFIRNISKIYEHDDLIFDWIPYDLMDNVVEDVETRRSLTNFQRFGIYEQGILVALNDCMYKLSARFSHVLIIDLDELLIPSREKTIQDMMLDISQGPDVDIFYNVSGYSFNTAWYFDNWYSSKDTQIFPRTSTKDNVTSLYFVNHKLRTEVMDVQPKSIIGSHCFLAVNWHGTTRVHPLCNKSLNLFVGQYVKFGFIHHFRNDCSEKFYNAECAEMITKLTNDTTLSTLKQRLEGNGKIQFISDT